VERLSKLVTPPRVHKHRYCGVLAPNAKLRAAVIESAGPGGATLQLLENARRQMGLDDTPDPDADKPTGGVRRAAARCWALLLARLYECLPLRCPQCGAPMRIIAFVLEREVIERMESLRDPACGDDCGTSASRPNRRPSCRPGHRRSGNWRSTRTPAAPPGRTWTRRPARRAMPGTEPRDNETSLRGRLAGP